jgi:hypothetical protein
MSFDYYDAQSMIYARCGVRGMSDPIEEALRHGGTGVMHHPPDPACVRALEALAVLRGRLAEAELQRDAHIQAFKALCPKLSAAEASLVTLTDALREIAEAEDFVDVEDVQAYARAALASSEGEGNA